MTGSGCVAPADIDAAFSQLIADTLRTMALDEGMRTDGRGLSDLRPVFCEVPMSNEQQHVLRSGSLKLMHSLQPGFGSHRAISVAQTHVQHSF